uniref:Uncharacterized protein n=1 Tax=Chromera velia CCMP2878 TaxID=1169474 RepID=A0A0G4GMT9_9ALVE|eukprot:Cvel_22570.t1-p1 / transcript=Cvel_22570.t1 / gene=Cvel_22570 / organism=Chromera_velia_CCMP2878 / gene_product=hypothetical protein / transcript_product=hypothetical protein / location=Cvel_scaffold2230:21202-22111(-) / protein_length=179 / sequence_SO=supercontig / SO=protein_coding / is_pseudo=false
MEWYGTIGGDYFFDSSPDPNAQGTYGTAFLIGLEYAEGGDLWNFICSLPAVRPWGEKTAADEREQITRSGLHLFKDFTSGARDPHGREKGPEPDRARNRVVWRSRRRGILNRVEVREEWRTEDPIKYTVGKMLCQIPGQRWNADEALTFISSAQVAHSYQQQQQQQQQQPRAAAAALMC